MSSSPSIPVTVRCHGVRGSIPSPGSETARYGGNTSCVELRCGGDLLILDAGSGLRSLGNELAGNGGAQPVEADLLISHTHWDHIQGLPFFSPGYCPQNQIRIQSAPGYGPRVKMALINQMTPLNFPVAFDQMPGIAGFHQLETDGNKLGAFTVHTAELNHPGGCAGFRIEAEGIAVGYLPDHEPYQIESGNGQARNKHEKLVEFIRGLDLLILDTQYTAEEYIQRRGWGHGSLPESVRLAMEGDVRRLLLFHHDPLHLDIQIDQMVESARVLAAGSPTLIDAAAENETLTLTEPLSARAISPSMVSPLPKPLTV